MKKTLLLVSTLVMFLALAFSLTLSATNDDTTVRGTWDNLTWELNKSTGHLTISGEGEMKDFSNYPNAWLNYRADIKTVTVESGVTSIGWDAFSYCQNMTAISLPEGIISIGNDAFEGCSALTELDFPNSITSIGDCACSDLENLTRIWLPDSLVTIGGYNLFVNLPHLQYNTYEGGLYLGSKSNPYLLFVKPVSAEITSFTLHEDTRIIHADAFDDCFDLTNVTIPSKIVSIGSSTFGGCPFLSRVSIADLAAWCNIAFFDQFSNPLYHGADLYVNNTLITDLVIPDGVTVIGSYAFANARGLTSVVMPNSVTSIGEGAFSDCYQMTSIVLPDDLTTIESEAFHGCSNLTEIILPNRIASIGKDAFSNCRSLQSIVLPDSITVIEDSAFSGCSSLQSVVLPDSITVIEDGAFSGCSSLQSVVLPDSITVIGIRAFGGCSSLTDITIPSNVTTIGHNAFRECSALTNIVIPNGVTFIGETAFCFCDALVSITLPNSLKKLADDAFLFCSSFQEIIYCGTPEEWKALRYETDKVIFHQYQWEPLDAEHHKGICSICNEETKGAHDYQWESLDAEHHKAVCTFCDEETEEVHIWNDGEITTPPTHLADGIKTYTCTDCGKERTQDVAKLAEHSFGAWEGHDDNQHKKSCACGELQYADHAWDGGTVNGNEKTLTCGECGYTKTELLPKEKGCSGSALGGASVLTLLLPAAYVLWKKKK